MSLLLLFFAGKVIPTRVYMYSRRPKADDGHSRRIFFARLGQGFLFTGCVCVCVFCMYCMFAYIYYALFGVVCLPKKWVQMYLCVCVCAHSPTP